MKILQLKRNEEGARSYSFSPSSRNEDTLLQTARDNGYHPAYGSVKGNCAFWDIYQRPLDAQTSETDALGTIMIPRSGADGIVTIKLRRGEAAQRLDSLLTSLELE
jgi:hypothetical protein